MVGHIFLAALCRFLKRKGDACLYVTAAARCVRVRTASAAPETATEEAVENIGKIKTACAAGIRISAARAAAEVRVYARKAELVVARLLVWVAQNLVRLVDLLELLLGFLVAGVHVGVILACELFVCFFDLFFRSALGNAEHLVIVSFIFSHRLRS